MEKSLRPTKKQKELLGFIQTFIAENGYSPAYREIMNGLGYNSVATVALHINNLIKRGHLIKRENSARSLELTHPIVEKQIGNIKETDSAWLFDHIEQRFKAAEKELEQTALDEIYVLIGAIKVLGFKEQAVSYIIRLRTLESAVSQ